MFNSQRMIREYAKTHLKDVVVEVGTRCGMVVCHLVELGCETNLDVKVTRSTGIVGSGTHVRTDGRNNQSGSKRRMQCRAEKALGNFCASHPGVVRGLCHNGPVIVFMSLLKIVNEKLGVVVKQEHH